MKSKSYFLAFTVTALAFVACTPDPDDTIEPSGTVQSNSTAIETPSVTDRNIAPVRAPEPIVVKPTIIAAGTVMEVTLIDPISTDTSLPGDVFRASLTSPISIGGSTVVDAGVRVGGRIVELQQPGRVNGRARIEMVLTEIVGESMTIPISTSPFVEEADMDLGRDATLGAAGGAVGALIGGLAGGRKGAIVGGAAGGAGTVLATRGDQLEYPAESRFSFTVTKDVEVPAGKTIS